MWKVAPLCFGETRKPPLLPEAISLPGVDATSKLPP